MKVIYIADDGKEFEGRFECEEYELSQKMEKYSGSIIGVDGFLQRIPLNGDFIDNAQYVYLADEAAVSAFKEICRQLDMYSSPSDFEKPGLYVWNEEEYGNFDCGSWVPVDDILENCQDIIKTLTAAKELFG